MHFGNSKMTKMRYFKGVLGSKKIGNFYSTFLSRLEIRFYKKITKICVFLIVFASTKCRNFKRKMYFFSKGPINTAQKMPKIQLYSAF